MNHYETSDRESRKEEMHKMHVAELSAVISALTKSIEAENRRMGELLDAERKHRIALIEDRDAARSEVDYLKKQIREGKLVYVKG